MKSAMVAACEPLPGSRPSSVAGSREERAQEYLLLADAIEGPEPPRGEEQASLVAQQQQQPQPKDDEDEKE
jgi:hypothetical protein